MQYRPAFLVGVLVAIAAGGCGASKCLHISCPFGDGTVVVPADLPAPVSVTADTPCSIGSLPPYMQLIATLSFQAHTCCGSYAPTPATFTVVTSGAGDGATAD